MKYHFDFACFAVLPVIAFTVQIYSFRLSLFNFPQIKQFPQKPKYFKPHCRRKYIVLYSSTKFHYGYITLVPGSILDILLQYLVPLWIYYSIIWFHYGYFTLLHGSTIDILLQYLVTLWISLVPVWFHYGYITLVPGSTMDILLQYLVPLQIYYSSTWFHYGYITLVPGSTMKISCITSIPHIQPITKCRNNNLEKIEVKYSQRVNQLKLWSVAH